MRSVSDAWETRIYAIVRQIPAGRVATYGLVGLLAGRPRAARAVGNVMRQCADASVPCHRVVHANGAPAFSRHATRLRREGVRFMRDRVDMTRYLWRPRLPASRS
jgi:methylated-DNA-protein-cysteine methyltransferase-like protein